MIKIDGSKGEGGGQVLRSALALSMLTGKAFHIENVRGGRKKPGLLRQHLTGVEAATKISNAKCSDVSLGASELEFHPSTVSGGNHRFAVGTAGSTSLVLQTILPPLLIAEELSTLIIEGGTHAKSAPPFEFLEKVFVPIVNRMGAKMSVRLLQHGFYPAGGGRVEIIIEPAKDGLKRLDLLERGKLIEKACHVLIAGMPDHVAKRENGSARQLLGWGPEDFTSEKLSDSNGPGNVQLITAQFENITEVTSGFGEIGVPAYRVGKKNANRMKGFMDSDAAVGPYLADQLLLLMVMAGGGSFTTVKPSLHTRTNMDIIRQFMDCDIVMIEQDEGPWLIKIN